MKTIDQIETAPSVGSRRNLNTRTAVTPLAPQREPAADKNAIRPFHLNVPEAELADLRRRIEATRLPEKEPVADMSQGVPLTTVEKLARYWANEYDWRKAEARINAF